MDCSELMLIIDVVLNIVIHIYIDVVLCSSNIALLICWLYINDMINLILTDYDI